MITIRSKSAGISSNKPHPAFNELNLEVLNEANEKERGGDMNSIKEQMVAACLAMYFCSVAGSVVDG